MIVILSKADARHYSAIRALCDNEELTNPELRRIGIEMGVRDYTAVDETDGAAGSDLLNKILAKIDELNAGTDTPAEIPVGTPKELQFTADTVGRRNEQGVLELNGPLEVRLHRLLRSNLSGRQVVVPTDDPELLGARFLEASNPAAEVGYLFVVYGLGDVRYTFSAHKKDVKRLGFALLAAGETDSYHAIFIKWLVSVDVKTLV